MLTMAVTLQKSEQESASATLDMLSSSTSACSTSMRLLPPLEIDWPERLA